MSVSVFIDGAAGTTGLDIRERLAGRSDVHVVALDEARRKDAGARRAALNDADVVMLCLPDEAAREAVALIDNPRTRVIDASSAHRVADEWTYGFPELGFDIAGARRVSNPGCYATGFLALVAPLVRSGVIPAGWPLSVNAVSGYTGGGKAMIAEFEGPFPPAYRAYATTLAHKHLPEMRLHAGLAHPPVFAPAVVNTPRGMVVELPLFLDALPGRPTLDRIEAAWRDTFEGSALVGVGERNPATVAVEQDAGSDRLTLHACGNEETGQARLVATLDNLGKGAGGAAVQNLNLLAGLDPLAGLRL